MENDAISAVKVYFIVSVFLLRMFHIFYETNLKLRMKPSRFVLKSEEVTMKTINKRVKDAMKDFKKG